MDGPLFSFGEQLFDIMAVSILWAICCVPVVTIGPATCALYYVAVKQVRKRNGSLIKNFFGSFRESLGPGIRLTCIVLIYATVMAAAIWAHQNGFLGSAGAYLSYAAKVLLLPLLLVLPYIAPIMSRFSIGAGAVIKLSFVMSVRFLWRTILSLALIAGTVILLWLIPFCIFALPGVCALVCSFLIEPALRKYTPRPDAGEPAPWYWQ